jgi:predicted ATPase/transcriptional regulator with XRE-family HTH domain
MGDLFSFGAWVRRRRKALDLTQNDLARRIGYAESTLRKIESDARRPSRQVAERLATALELPAAEYEPFLRAARGELAVDHLAGLSVPAPVALRAPANRPTPFTLPIQRTSLIGRTAEVATICDRLRHNGVRLLTITGPGGTGKTRLALQVASELIDMFADGVFFIDFAPVADPTLVASTIAGVLGVQETGDQPFVARLKTYLRSKHVLLVLDNLEHLLPGAAVIDELLTATSSVAMLITSRTVLHLYGEHEIVVPPLAVPDLLHLPALDRLSNYAAVRLFIERARAVQADFHLTQTTASAVAEICVRLDGLPLAIELAAVRSKLLPPHALLTRLSHRLKLLVGGPQSLSARQQTLRNTIDWSYNLLQAGEQTLFWRLAVFVGGGTIEAVEAVCNVQTDLPFDLLDGLQSLLDHSLLRQELSLKYEPRFGMLETIREYALERLELSGEADAIRRRHAIYHLELAQQAEKESPVQQRMWLDRLERELGNLRAALAWCRTMTDGGEIELRLATLLFWFWRRRGSISEGRVWIMGALARSHAGGIESGKQARAHGLNAAGLLAYHQGDHAVACALLEEAVLIFQEGGDERALAFAMATLGLATMAHGDDTRARQLCEASLALRRAVGDQRGLAHALACLGQVAVGQGDYAAALPALKEGLALFREVGDSWGVTFALRHLGDMAAAQGNDALAVAQYEEGLALSRDSGDWLYVAQLLGIVGAIEGRQGNDARATALLMESVGLLREYGDMQSIPHCLEALACVATRQEQRERAIRLFGAAAALRESLKAPQWPIQYAVVERALAAVRTQSDAVTFAAAWNAGHALTLHQALSEAAGLARALEKLEAVQCLQHLSSGSAAGHDHPPTDVAFSERT